MVTLMIDTVHINPLGKLKTEGYDFRQNLFEKSFDIVNQDGKTLRYSSLN